MMGSFAVAGLRGLRRRYFENCVRLLDELGEVEAEVRNSQAEPSGRLRVSAPINFVQLVQIFRGCMPFLALVLLAMIMVYVFPDLVFYLPNLIYGR